MDHPADHLHMRRALALAQLGHGHVSPNPMVGCVIVYNDKIIGEGWHQRYGEAHAEVNAVNDVADKSLLSRSTVYVSLEPCNHVGKTPPCADLLIRHQVKRVVIANLDPNPIAVGGAQKLREAGIEVTVGILEAEGYELNRRFFTWIGMKRPYIILKWAQTSDGFIAKDNFDSKWISNELSRQLVHKWRTQEDAVLVGRRTAQHDDPQLNVRDWTGRNPTRIVIDRYLTLSESIHLFDGTQPTLVYNTLRNEQRPNCKLISLEEHSFLPDLINDLYKQRLQSIIVEGGAHTLQSFMDAGYWDEAKVFVSKGTLLSGIKAPIPTGVLKSSDTIGSDFLFTYRAS